MNIKDTTVIPAQAGTHVDLSDRSAPKTGHPNSQWIPAYAGKTLAGLTATQATAAIRAQSLNPTSQPTPPLTVIPAQAGTHVDLKAASAKATFDDTDNPRQLTKYNAAGEVEWQQDERGNKSYFKYDLAGRQIEVKDALNRITTTTYDAAGQRTSMTDALNRTTKFVYDGAGRMLETIYPDPLSDDSDDTNNPRMKIGYDLVGRKVSETDEMNRITRFTYDVLGRLTQVILPNPVSGLNPPLVDGISPATAGTLLTKYEYDEQGNKTAQIDAEGRRTAWTFDVVGRNLTRKLPMGQVESHTYNVAGERTKHTSFNAIDTLFNYDGQGRMDKVSFPNNRIRQFTYDVAGKVTGIDDGGQSYVFEYDERDRLTKAIDSYGRAIQYAYDASGNRTLLKTAKQEISYAYDELNRLAEVVTSTNAGNVGWAVNQKATYQYDEVGNRAGMLNPNGTVVSYQYDRRNRLKGLVHKASVAANAALLLGLSYTVDASGLRTQIVDTRPSTTAGQILTRTTAYTYDSVKRLTAEVVSGGLNRNSAWTYSKVGNRLTQQHSGSVNGYTTYSYDANDRLIAEPNQSVTYTHDANGNLVTKKVSNVTQAEYRWDEENRMVGATLGVGAAQKIVSYAYDPNGIRRAQEEVAGSVRKRTEYLVDANTSYAQVSEEWGSAGTATGALGDETLAKTYVFGDDLISQTKLALDGTGTNSFYHYDGLGTTRALSNSAGAVTDRNVYTAFGENDPAGTSGWTSGTTDNNFKYTGEQLDPNLGFYYLRARYMNPSVGGFISQDSYMGSSSDPASLHKYAYVQSMPTMHIDPTGNYTQSFGNDVHDYVCDEYKSFRVNASVDCGARVYFNAEKYLMPDIFDRSSRLYGEVKPLSVSGIYGGIAQIATYDAAFGSNGWRRLSDWWPPPTQIQGYQVYFFNTEGIIFYTDDSAERQAMAGKALGVLASNYKRHLINGPKKKNNSNSPLGGEVIATRLIYAAVGAVAFYSALQMQQLQTTSYLMRF